MKNMMDDVIKRPSSAVVNHQATDSSKRRPSSAAPSNMKDPQSIIAAMDGSRARPASAAPVENSDRPKSALDQLPSKTTNAATPGERPVSAPFSSTGSTRKVLRLNIHDIVVSAVYVHVGASLI